MQDDNKKFNSWWQSTWATSYIKTVFLGLVAVVSGVTIPNLPGIGRFLFIVIGLIISIASYFAAKSRWKKI